MNSANFSRRDFGLKAKDSHQGHDAQPKPDTHKAKVRNFGVKAKD